MCLGNKLLRLCSHVAHRPRHMLRYMCFRLARSQICAHVSKHLSMPAFQTCPLLWLTKIISTSTQLKVQVGFFFFSDDRVPVGYCLLIVDGLHARCYFITVIVIWLDVRKFSFSNWVVDNWNSLTDTCVNCITVIILIAIFQKNWNWKPVTEYDNVREYRRYIV